MSYGILAVCAAAALLMIALNLWVLTKIEDKEIVIEGTIFLLFSACRYVALLIYGDSPDYEMLQQIRYFYFASSIGVTMMLLIAIWYVTPFLREKIKGQLVPIFFLPWNLFYLYVILKQPTRIIRGSRYGYELILTGRFPTYLSIVQGSILGIMFVLCLIGIFKYKHLQIRVQLFFFIAAQFLLALDGMSYYLAGAKVFSPFTLTEAFAFAAVYYALKYPVKLRYKS